MSTAIATSLRTSSSTSTTTSSSFASWFPSLPDLSWMWDILNFLGLKDKKGRLLFLGLDNAGKTTLLHRLATGAMTSACPTIQPNVETLQLGGINLTTIDMGGHQEARRLWKDYFVKIDGVVFVVDASDPARFAEAKFTLDMLLKDEEIRTKPFMILGNKIDLPHAVSEEHLIAALGLTGQTTGKKNFKHQQQNLAAEGGSGTRPVEVFMCSIVKKVGYSAGFHWISKFIK